MMATILFGEIHWAATMVIGLVVVQALVLVVIRFRHRAVRTADEDRARTRCPDCQQKVAYLPRNVGLEVKCSRCKGKFKLPAVAS